VKPDWVGVAKRNGIKPAEMAEQAVRLDLTTTTRHVQQEDDTMKTKTMILMFVAIGCGLVASFLTSRLIAERGNAATAEPKIKVLVAKKKIFLMTLLTKPEDYFVEKEMPLEAVPKKAIKSLEELGKGKDAKRVNKMLNEEQMITTDDLVSKDLDGMAAGLKPGSRAIGLKVDPVCLVGGFVLPGSRVDVVSTTRDGEAKSEIILQDMLVLAVDMQSGRKEDGSVTMLGNTVTMAAVPEEAMKLTLASTLGELRLLLRPIEDHEQTRSRAATRGNLSKPVITGTDSGQNGDQMLAQAGTAKIPTDLPPVADTQTPSPMAEPDPEQKPVRQHTMSIMTGEYVQKFQFIMNDDGTFAASTNRNEAEAGKEPKAPKDRPTWPKPIPPAEKKDEPAKSDPNPPRPIEKLLQSAGRGPLE
jgi:pilus assembly protein CpaB